MGRLISHERFAAHLYQIPQGAQSGTLSHNRGASCAFRVQLTRVECFEVHVRAPNFAAALLQT
jgi:hypothetical protein